MRWRIPREADRCAGSVRRPRPPGDITKLLWRRDRESRFCVEKVNLRERVLTLARAGASLPPKAPDRASVENGHPRRFGDSTSPIPVSLPIDVRRHRVLSCAESKPLSEGMTELAHEGVGHLAVLGADLRG